MKSLSRLHWKNTYSGGLLKTLVVLSIPTIVEEVLATLLQYVDTAMVGQLGEQATASVSITTTITWLFNSIPGAIGTAVLILISKAAGAGDRKQVKRLAQQALFLSVLSGVVLGAASMGISPFVPAWMGAEPAIQEEASRYYFIVSRYSERPAPFWGRLFGPFRTPALPCLSVWRPTG